MESSIITDNSNESKKKIATKRLFDQDGKLLNVKL